MNHSTFSILFPKKKTELQCIPPAFFEDLQLAAICKAIVSKYTDFDVQKFFYTLPGSTDTIPYRQNVYRDLERNPSMAVALKQYSNRLLQCENCYQLHRQAEDKEQKGSYLLLACQHYLSALELLQRTLADARLQSEGFLTLSRILNETMSAPEFLAFQDEVYQAFSYMEQMKLTLWLNDREIRVTQEEPGESETIIEKLKNYLIAFDIFAEEEWSGLDEEIHHLFPAPLQTSPLENQIVEILKKSSPQVFQTLRQFSDYEFSLENDMFLTFKNEILFYISFLEFEKQLNDAGFFLQYPVLRQTDGLELNGVYDIALAWKNRFSGTPVIPNDILYQRNKTFLVVTGPNQGGKTTLARAAGQAVYFMLLGLKAPCSSMNSRFFERILTHFEVEESVETGAGKLKEELQRLRPMMHLYAQNSFVILNELFTTATTYDAQIMAHKVMSHFMQNQCLGIYVTHIQELADENANEGVQSMVAQVDETDSSVRTFKIIPATAKGLGYSDTIVKKYGLDYDQVTRRLEVL